MAKVFGSLTIENQQLTHEQLAQIRSLDDFDLIMLISEIHDYGWPQAARTLEIIIEAQSRGRKDIRGKLLDEPNP